MNSLIPRSLLGQTLAIILAGLALSQLVGAWIYTNDRTEAIHAIGGMAAAQRIANLSRLIEESAPKTRDHMTQMVSDPTFRVVLSSANPDFEGLSDPTPATTAIKGYLIEELSRPNGDGILVSLSGTTDSDTTNASLPEGRALGPSGRPRMAGMGMGRGRMSRGMGVWRELTVGIRLDDGQWLTFRSGIPDQAPARSWWFFASLGVMAVIVLTASAFAMKRAVAPLRLLGNAADRFGRDTATEPLVERGPSEIRIAITAFNRMQSSLRRLLDNRSRMLAGVSHDLRTPLTLLRLRVEGVENAEERERMLATIADMEGMITAALDFARQTGKSEARRPTDITALLSSIVDDMADAGMSVTLEPAAPAVCQVQAARLKRALTNLIDNAVKFGRRVRITVEPHPAGIEIVIDDWGPGIPEEMMPRVFEPFFRFDESRNSETGGTGLGLAIALAIVQNHGGNITLSNRAEGGLEARLFLPNTETH